MLCWNDFFEDTGVSTLVTDRSLDFKLNSSAQLSQKQKEILSRAIGRSIEHAAYLNQVHGNTVIPVGQNFFSMDFLPEADGLMTDQPNLPLLIRTADCLPVFIFDPVKKGIGLVHAGWRGSRKEIVKNAVELMQRHWQTQPSRLKIVFGPSIRKCCYQVGGEFRDYFPQEVEQRPGGFYLDLVEANRNQLFGAGGEEDNIFDCGICTCCDRRFFSYRREGRDAGRMISLIMLH